MGNPTSPRFVHVAPVVDNSSSVLPTGAPANSIEAGESFFDATGRHFFKQPDGTVVSPKFQAEAGALITSNSGIRQGTYNFLDLSQPIELALPSNPVPFVPTTLVIIKGDITKNNLKLVNLTKFMQENHAFIDVVQPPNQNNELILTYIDDTIGWVFHGGLLISEPLA